MNHKQLAISLFFLAVSMVTLAQTQTVTNDTEFMARTSLGVDWKIVKGLHLETGYELRSSGNLKGIERHQLTVGLRYSPINHLDIGGGYCYIGHYDEGHNFKPSHRVFADISGSYKFGAWKLSLRERVQLTHKSYEFNEFQQTPNSVELKSRLKLEYKGFVHIEPYTYLELRNCFNGPSFNAEYDETTGKYSSYEFLGYSDAYINRLRLALGLEWNIDTRNCLDFKLMASMCRDKIIDTNAKGTKLKSFSWEKSADIVLAVGYVFSF